MISDQLRKEIEESYEIGEIRRVTALTGGYWNTVMRLESGLVITCFELVTLPQAWIDCCMNIGWLRSYIPM
ncbi:hypothetical protein [Paenibacillus sp. J2TS4]|uniref:hypothetical protein n=1 Tax=Paenibacillus sp. J2TS4 TaxID=2807194 RepID=UPI001B03E81F|nr:hypothetical protein [Paenibacillus sp. J2TS4]GIP30906.1 hypothetical protein J2TS4_01160 [Paenibacillus sp. J2TS4]